MPPKAMETTQPRVPVKPAAHVPEEVTNGRAIPGLHRFSRQEFFPVQRYTAILADQARNTDFSGFPDGIKDLLPIPQHKKFLQCG